jgi:hypothetical protein
MQVIEAPIYRKPNYSTTLFVGGGISNCADWQKVFIEYIEFFTQARKIHVTIFNPRRENFDVSDPKQSEVQIAWENYYLHRAKILVFWFPYETLCPIALFELGSALQYHKGPILIGCHADYKRIFDVTYQTRLERPEIEVVQSFYSLLQQTLDTITNTI